MFTISCKDYQHLFRVDIFRLFFPFVFDSVKLYRRQANAIQEEDNLFYRFTKKFVLQVQNNMPRKVVLKLFFHTEIHAKKITCSFKGRSSKCVYIFLTDTNTQIRLFVNSDWDLDCFLGAKFLLILNYEKPHNLCVLAYTLAFWPRELLSTFNECYNVCALRTM